MAPEDFGNRLPDEVKAKLTGCETPEELMALAQESGYELSDEELMNVSGGGAWSRCTHETCRAHNVGE